ncbi:MAG: AAA family ATPase [Candidatus Thiodiazotropha sp. (ex Notomyrtea botanica)]|nr:AAA family ATPase [Candidatus Thiodiazotropha sp. (ex Notomyrtea botanica)]
MEGLKNVRVSEPYQPGSVRTGELIGRTAELRLIAAAWMGGKDCIPLSPLLIGDPGLGKNRLVYEIARRTGKKLYVFQGHEDVTAEDLACSVRFSDDPDHKIDYVMSPLATAMKEGGVCFIDEIAKIRPRALALLASVLDDRRYLDSSLLGERIQAHVGFRFIAATNTADLDTNPLPDFMESRLRPVVEFGYPPADEINAIVRENFSRMDDSGTELLDQFWVQWGRYREGRPPAPRDAIQLFALASSMADFDHNNKEISVYEAGEDWIEGTHEGYRPAPITHEHLKQAFNELYGEDLSLHGE